MDNYSSSLFSGQITGFPGEETGKQDMTKAQ
jgi:hypothetical protein